MFLVEFLRRSKRTWPEANYKGEANDGDLLESHLATTEQRVVESLLDHELELFAAKICLFIQMPLEFVGSHD